MGTRRGSPCGGTDPENPAASSPRRQPRSTRDGSEPRAGDASGFHLRRRGYRVDVLWFIIVLLVVGFIAGALARLLVPGPDPMSLAATWLLGVLGSFVGGFLGYLIFGADIEDGPVQVGGVIGSIIGAVILLLIYRAVSRRSRGGRRLHA